VSIETEVKYMVRVKETKSLATKKPSFVLNTPQQVKYIVRALETKSLATKQPSFVLNTPQQDSRIVLEEVAALKVE
jgi:hypothetical protein